MSPLLLKDVFDIPESTGAEDYVLRAHRRHQRGRSGGGHHDYVVTPSLAQAFNDAFGQVDQALSTGRNTGAFLSGSFGSGKSHFMAVLHALLRHDPEARSIRELQSVLVQRDAMLQGKNFFPLAVHFLDGTSMEQVIFDGYVRQVRDLHPDAPLPAVYATDTLLQDGENLRRRMGDELFLTQLNGESAGGTKGEVAGEHGDVWGGLLGSNTWTVDRYHRSLAAAPGSQKRQDLVSALQSQYFPNYHRMGEHVSMDEGLRAISVHAQQLGYDAGSDLPRRTRSLAGVPDERCRYLREGIPEDHQTDRGKVRTAAGPAHLLHRPPDGHEAVVRRSRFPMAASSRPWMIPSATRRDDSRSSSSVTTTWPTWPPRRLLQPKDRTGSKVHRRGLCRDRSLRGRLGRAAGWHEHRRNQPRCQC